MSQFEEEIVLLEGESDVPRLVCRRGRVVLSEDVLRAELRRLGVDPD